MSNKNVRSSQLLSPFGIGQIINFPKEVSMMVCGLNLWDEKIKQRITQAGRQNIDEIALRIIEPRLQKVLGVDYFIKPFSFNTSGLKNNFLSIPAVRFPRWHYCTNHLCGSMREVELTFAQDKIECTTCCTANFKAKMIPVRFIAACSNGHIQDVPFKEWVHNGNVPNDDRNHNLSYHSLSGSGDLGSILIKCSCGDKKTLAGLMNVTKNGDNVFDSALGRIGFDKEEDKKFSEEDPNDKNPLGQYCKGHRPWLGLEGVINPKPCNGNKHLQVLIRGASNVHFSDIISALYLPKISTECNEYVTKVIEEKGRTELKKFYDQDNGERLLPAILSMELVVKNGLISKEDLISGVIAELLIEDSNQDINNCGITSEQGLRFEEYEYILAGRDSENADFKAVKKNFEGYKEKDLLEKYFECIVLVEKLKETRVFRSFARINPSNKVDMSELSNKPVNWLPANEVYGEGIFLKFKDDVIDEWLETENGYFSDIINRYQSAMLKRRPRDEPKNLNASFIAMHTFAHLLIKKLCFQCGYGSSSLRERLYFSDDVDNRMNGILIYTSSGDSEGSLGGLVRQGKANYFGKLVKDAIEDAEWCSADPVCSDIGQSSGQGPDNVNGSACHNCCIVPETSCEEFNMLLDRATIIGTMDSKIGFFNSTLEI